MRSHEPESYAPIVFYLISVAGDAPILDFLTPFESSPPVDHLVPFLAGKDDWR